MLRILLVHNDALVRALLEIYICAEKDCQLTASLGGDGLTARLRDGISCDLLLLDAENMDAAGEIKSAYPEMKLIVITAQPEYSYPAAARELGADSFWYIEPDRTALGEIIERTAAGESVYPSCARPAALGNAMSCDFSKRELEVLREVTRGLTDAAIAETLQLSVPTVKFHIQKIREKSGFATRTELAVRARESGIVICRN